MERGNIFWKKYGSHKVEAFSGGGAAPGAGGVLPVELLSFSGRQKGVTNLLNWQTATEINNKGFEIQKSKDSKTWQKIGWIDGLGNSIEQQNYQFTDKQPYVGINYYRLKQIDIGGLLYYSKTISISRKGDRDDFIQLFPNPVVGRLYVIIKESNPISKISVFDALGRKVGIPVVEMGNGFELNFEEIEAGTYFVFVETNQKHWIKKIVK